MTIGMAIILVATVGFLIVSPGFRKVTEVIAAGAIVLLLSFWIANRPIESRDPAPDRPRWQAEDRGVWPTPGISAQELDITNVKMERPSWAIADGGSLDEWLLTGTVTNNSIHSLGSLTFEITVIDCPIPASAGTKASKSNCLTVGQGKQDASASVPPGQRGLSPVTRLAFQNCQHWTRATNASSTGSWSKLTLTKSRTFLRSGNRRSEFPR